ncbi:MAG: sensory box histidine kinase [uncultured bacterium]|uniref:histidine kinase n=3 Tax=Candidatus Daviesiibacteriota TaxID=1752718 RepID=A0A0G0EQK8_9BACT|nr:MAG: sensory box histidine kinase [uncultured bacterium]KKQ09203.1 MAG: Sensory box histidine kinase [Candidatus Daviesbacteria bacterium GW2011_GWB1_36_5]OGE16436.1 MAG: hypothetical protein A2858_01720 [Candidatus Daviesbacteria bacterium RIFCSPHIGHO2_01_FULL_36_37]OGE35316.1 MAG: hypothetical protein A3E66_00475 [Candidatus Daviesbacteria bacterium RIFCSPHIGHO2_12_FULL_37_16]
MQKYKKYFYWYILPLFFSLSPLILIYSLNLFAQPFNLYLLLLPSVAVSSYFGGLKGGILATTLTSLGMNYLFIVPNFTSLEIPQVLNLTFYILECIAVTVFITQGYHSELLQNYKTKAENLSKKLIKIQEDLTSAQSEIKLRDEFLSMASHELKTPLTSMLLQIQSALHNIKNVSLANFSVANLLKMLESVETQTERLSKMINDLLNVSLITTGKLELEKENFDLSKTVREVVNRFVEKLEKEGYTLSLEADKEILGNWDKLRIEQVITNLLTNAIKYGDKKPIEVRVINFNKSGKIHVKDQGIGIPAELQKKIFEKFERAVTSSQFQGSGLGLYITNQIVKAHNGKVHLKSREGKGSTFIVELPVAS